MKCEYCGCEISGDVIECPSCGAPVPQGGDSCGNDTCVDSTFCAYCGQLIPENARTCPNCGNTQFCPFCSVRFGRGENKCSRCGRPSPAYVRQVNYLERGNFDRLWWKLFLGLTLFCIIIASLASSYLFLGMAVALGYVCVVLARIPKEVDGIAIVSTPGYWLERYPIDMETQRENAFSSMVRRPSLLSKLNIRIIIVSVSCVVLGGAIDVAQQFESKSAKWQKNSSTLLLNSNVPMEFVHCPAGSFMMGSPENESDGNETRHRVTLTKPFWIGKYEVTQKQYKAVTGKNPSSFKGDDRPVECVNWYEAREFCNKLNELTKDTRPAGYVFSLPTEARWEYACRAGTTTVYAGNLNSMAWYDLNSKRSTHDVGEKRPNKWGIYDMHGNVWEWCQDWYGKYDTENVTDPEGAYSGSSRVYRGGSWGSVAGICRSADRFYIVPDFRYNSLGFRVALAPVQ